MRFAVAREELLRPLQLVSSVVERKQTRPILANLLAEGRDGALRLTATDLEVQLAVSLPAEALERPPEGGARATLPARKLADIVRALPEGAMVEVEAGPERAVLRSGRSRFTLLALPAEEFPLVEEVEARARLTVAGETLRALLERSHFAMAVQDVRYYLNGLLLEAGPGVLRAVATDGHRLACCEAGLEDGALEGEVGEGVQIIVPRKGVAELLRLLDGEEAVRLEIGANHLRVAADGRVLTSKLIEGRFPDYQRVIPQRSDKRLLADRAALREALQRASILSSEKYRSVRLELEGETLRITAHNPEQEEAEEELAVRYEGAPLVIGFNAGYLLDALGALDQEAVQVELTDPNSCCLIQGAEPDGCRYVVMPMRL